MKDRDETSKAVILTCFDHVLHHEEQIIFGGASLCVFREQNPITLSSAKPSIIRVVNHCLSSAELSRSLTAGVT